MSSTTLLAAASMSAASRYADAFPDAGRRPRAIRRGARLTRRVGAVCLAAALLGVASAATASAHVRVHPDSTAAGSYAQLTFRVPNESDTAGTTAVSVQLPSDTPFTSVSLKPLPGWSGTAQESQLAAPVQVGGATITRAVTSVTWTADPGVQIAPGQYQEFSISVGPLPAEGSEVLLPATQTYSDGSVVAWNEPESAGGQEPENPAPQLLTTAAISDEGEHATSGSSEDATTDAETKAAASNEEGSSTGTWLGAGGLALGALALILSLLALARSRRTSPRA